jgi:hypothetical protein
VTEISGVSAYNPFYQFLMGRGLGRIKELKRAKKPIS